MSGQRSHSEKVSDPKDLKSQPTPGLPLLALQETNSRFFRGPQSTPAQTCRPYRGQRPWAPEPTSLSLLANLPTGGNTTEHRQRRAKQSQGSKHCVLQRQCSRVACNPKARALARTKLRRSVLPPADQKGEDEGKCRAYI